MYKLTQVNSQDSVYSQLGWYSVHQLHSSFLVDPHAPLSKLSFSHHSVLHPIDFFDFPTILKAQ